VGEGKGGGGDRHTDPEQRAETFHKGYVLDLGGSGGVGGQGRKRGIGGHVDGGTRGMVPCIGTGGVLPKVARIDPEQITETFLMGVREGVRENEEDRRSCKWQKSGNDP